MPVKSTIRTLPKQVLERLNFLIGENALTVDALTEWLDAQGHPRSRSAVHRHAQKINQVAARLRESREVTDAVVAELGDAATQGKQGRLLVEMTRSLVFDLLVKLQPGEDDDGRPDLDAKDVAMLGKGLAELGRALRFDQDFEEKIRSRAEAEARASAAEVAAGAAKEGGLSDDTVQLIRSRILGLVK